RRAVAGATVPERLVEAAEAVHDPVVLRGLGGRRRGPGQGQGRGEHGGAADHFFTFLIVRLNVLVAALPPDGENVVAIATFSEPRLRSLAAALEAFSVIVVLPAAETDFDAEAKTTVLVMVFFLPLTFLLDLTLYVAFTDTRPTPGNVRLKV